MADALVREFARYDIDAGTIEVAIVPSGLPQLTSILPAPFMSDEDRIAAVWDARRSAHLDGYWIVEQRPVRNAAFDRRGERTSTRFVVRPCRTEAEAAETVQLIQGHLSDIASAKSARLEDIP